MSSPSAASGRRAAPTPALKVLLVDVLAAETVETIAANLTPGWSCDCLPSPGHAGRATVLAEADLIFVTGSPVDRDLLAAAPRIRVVHKLGAGTDRVDLEVCRERGIAVFRLEGGNAHVVAEHTIMLMLAALRQLPVVDRKTRAGAWLKEPARAWAHQLAGKCVGLVGFGAVGQAVAQRLKAFEARVIYHDLVRPDRAVEEELECRWLPLDQLVASADIVSLHLPLTVGTRRLFDAARIAKLKPGALLVNTARGGLLDEKALTEALAAGRLAGAALDTFEVEPPANSELMQLEQVIVTPHMAGVSSENVAQLVQRACGNVTSYLSGLDVPTGDIVFDPRQVAG